MSLSPWKILFFILASLLFTLLISVIAERSADDDEQLCITLGEWKPCLKYFSVAEVTWFSHWERNRKEIFHRSRVNDSIRREEQQMAREVVSREDTTRMMMRRADLDSAKIWLPANNRDWFRDLFGNWESLKSHKKLFRIVHYGDSQIEMDRITSVLRNRLQRKFGGSGPGFLPPWQLIPSSTVAQAASETWRRYLGYGVAEQRAWHRNYGIGGMVFYFDSGYAHMSISSRIRKDSLLSRFEVVKVIAGKSPNAFSVTVSANGKRFTETFFGESEQMAVWELPAPVSQVSLSFSGDTSAAVLGVAIDPKWGIAMDNIPWRGSSGMTFNGISKSSLASTYKLLDVGMVILQFGGNSVPYIKTEEQLTQFANGFRRQIEHIKSAAPGIKILVIGPADMSYNNKGTMETYPMMESIIEAMKSVTLESGAAFYSMYHAMGGRNSMARWVNMQPPLSTPDYIHFTQKGSDVIANQLYKVLEREYEIYKRSQKAQ
jgi:lysophospholipase L1-like esterase